MKMKATKNKKHPLAKGTLLCPQCKQKLHFKMIQGMRLIENGMLDAFCPTDNTYYYVKSN